MYSCPNAGRNPQRARVLRVDRGLRRGSIVGRAGSYCRARRAHLGCRRTGGRAVRVRGRQPGRRAGRLRGGSRGDARARAGGAGALRPERLEDADPVAGARDIRHRAQRHRGDAGARGAGRVLAPVLPVHRTTGRAPGRHARARSRVDREVAGRDAGRQPGVAPRQGGRRRRRPVRRRRRTVRRSRARAHRRRVAGRHHRRALRAPPPVAGGGGRRRGGRLRDRDAPAGRRPAAGDRSRAGRADRVRGLAAHARALAARQPAPGGARGGARRRSPRRPRLGRRHCRRGSSCCCCRARW